MMKPQFDNIPDALRELRQWLLWRYEKQSGEAKTRKVPYYLNGKRRHGKQGSKADRKALATFDAVVAAYKRGKYDGIGLAMLPDADLSALDLDDCIDDKGTLSPLAQEIINACPTYCERSPSGRGLRLFYRGSIHDKKNHKAGIEAFHAKGFVTITGVRFDITRSGK